MMKYMMINKTLIKIMKEKVWDLEIVIEVVSMEVDPMLIKVIEVEIWLVEYNLFMIIHKVT
jgi:hypothetical protein